MPGRQAGTTDPAVPGHVTSEAATGASKHMHTTAQRLLPLTALIPCWLVHVGLSGMWLLGFAALVLTSLTVDSECLNQPN